MNDQSSQIEILFNSASFTIAISRKTKREAWRMINHHSVKSCLIKKDSNCNIKENKVGSLTNDQSSQLKIFLNSDRIAVPVSRKAKDKA